MVTSAALLGYDVTMRTALYIHFPFCIQKCLYCDFNSTADTFVSHKEYTDALIREMEFHSKELPDTPSSSSLYLGGGTPSLLEPLLAKSLIDSARQLLSLSPDAEVTLEANPGTVTIEKLKALHSFGFNRLSLGIQSFSDPMLKRLGRIHTASEAVIALSMARESGFDNIGIDLIHSLPGQTTEMWIEELDRAISLQPEHISAYGLTIEPGTPFYSMEKNGKISIPDDETAARMFELTSDILTSKGYEQYEISNFALPGCRSRHNQVYWKREDYLGFGAGAHSFRSRPPYGNRWKNISSPERYMQSLANGSLPVEEVSGVSMNEAMTEWIFLGLRMLDGIDTDSFQHEFGTSIGEVYANELTELQKAGLLEWKGDRLRLTRDGLIVSNQVFMKFVR
jgi:oxygen-independent coproporphyrinogen-3 oxidase